MQQGQVQKGGLATPLSLIMTSYLSSERQDFSLNCLEVQLGFFKELYLWKF